MFEALQAIVHIILMAKRSPKKQATVKYFLLNLPICLESFFVEHKD
jgi:hypothetical protein